MNNYLILVIYVVSGILLGFIFEKIIIYQLKKITEKTKWKGDDIIVRSFKNMIICIFGLIGVYYGIKYITLKPDISDFIKNSLKIIAVFIITIITSRILSGFVKLYSNNNKNLVPSSSILLNLTKVIVFVIGFLFALQSVGVSVTPLLTALGIGGLAVALALQDTLSNLFAGLTILVSKQINQGDYIKLENGDEGYIIDITWRNTSIKALSNRIIIIPNSKLASSIINNYSIPDKEISVLINIGVSYSSDLNKVERVTIETAQETMKTVTGAISEFNPFIRYNAFGDYAIEFTVILRAKEFVDQYLIKHEFIKNLHERYLKENIEIPFPITVVKLQNEK